MLLKKSDSPTVIKLENISKTYKISQHRSDSIRSLIPNLIKKSQSQEILALKGIDLEIKQGECVGIIGRNGSGKSTLMNIMMESIRPDQGGKVSSLGKMIRLELGMGVDINISARDNIYLNGSVLGLSFRQIGAVFNEIVSFAGIENFVDTPVKFFSKGMKSRLLFSIAMFAQADIFLLDEFFGGVGDKDFKRKSDIAFREKILNGKTIVIISHSFGIIKRHCQRCIWLDEGMVRLSGETKQVLKEYRIHKISLKNKKTE